LCVNWAMVLEEDGQMEVAAVVCTAMWWWLRADSDAREALVR